MKIYKPGEEVFAISRYRDKKGDTDHVGIFKVMIESYTVDKIGITYWVKTPSGDSWGDSVLASEVSKSRAKLFKKMALEWDLNSEWL